MSVKYGQGNSYVVINDDGSVSIYTAGSERVKIDSSGFSNYAGDFSGSGGYFRIGNLQICWGTTSLLGAVTGSPVTINFPAAFNVIPHIVTGLLRYSTDSVYAIIKITSKSTTSFQAQHDYPSSSAAIYMGWIAIGTWR